MVADFLFLKLNMNVALAFIRTRNLYRNFIMKRQKSELIQNL